jgi:hypothetical protein
MKKGTIGFFLLLWVGLHGLQAQEPDYLLESLPPVKGSTFIESERDISAKVSLYSFRDYLSLVIEVKDDFKDINPSEYLTDHIELYMALPSDAFPDGFVQETHPYYLYAPSLVSRGEEVPIPNRFFSSQNPALKATEVQDFLAENNYPSNAMIRQDSLSIPLSSQLSRKRIDYGIVHYGLFLDERTPVLYNNKYHQIIEKNLSLEMGAVESGITYVVDQEEDGYTFTLQIEPKALGFVRLPEMEKLRLAVDVIDTDGINQKGFSVLSNSQGGSHSLKERTFDEVTFKKPLQTNFSETPNRVYKQANYFPTFMYSSSGWIPTAIEIDGLYYKDQQASNSFSEISFLQRPQDYQLYTYPNQYLSVEHLSIDYEYVNFLGRTVHYILVNNQVFQSQLMAGGMKDSLAPPPLQIFFFPDGKPGLILAENATLSPYGWGKNGHDMDERIRIIRVLRDKSEELLRIEQGNGTVSYCHIGKKNYEGFFVEKINWAKEGELMVLTLKNRDTQSRKRVRIAWQADGSEITFQELP